jgi:hypothetical protein
MKYNIIAPHPDDEIIGCFQLLEKCFFNKIIYLPINDDLRETEVEKYCRIFGWDYEILDDKYDLLKLNKDETYFVPSLLDHHPDHKFVNIIMSDFKRGFYTTDMNTEFVKTLSKNEQEMKKILLNTYYPSQKSLWENDYKYFLFEGVVIEI